MAEPHSACGIFWPRASDVRAEHQPGAAAPRPHRRAGPHAPAEEPQAQTGAVRSPSSRDARLCARNAGLARRRARPVLCAPRADDHVRPASTWTRALRCLGGVFHGWSPVGPASLGYADVWSADVRRAYHP
ncbi:hypothetical protein FOMPIDRAFT_80243, partial [Fomitopsis schrenkii]